jgi:hypothetical protein
MSMDRSNSVVFLMRNLVLAPTYDRMRTVHTGFQWNKMKPCAILTVGTDLEQYDYLETVLLAVRSPFNFHGKFNLSRLVPFH